MSRFLPKSYKDRIFRLGREAFWVMGGQIGVAIGSLIGIKLLTYLLNPSEFGKFSVAITVTQLVVISFFGPLGQGLMRYWSISQDRHQLHEYVRYSRRFISYLFAGVLTGSIGSGLAIWYFKSARWATIFSLAMIGGAFTGWGEVRLSILRAARDRKRVSLINVSSSLLRQIAAAALITFISKNAEFAVLGYLASSITICLYAEYSYKTRIIKKLREKISDRGIIVSSRLGKDILNFSYPFFLWGIFGWIHQSCDRWALLSFQGVDVVGAYSVITQVAVYPLIFGSSFLNTFFLPIAYQSAGELQSRNSVAYANKILFAMAGIYIIGAAVLIITFFFFHSHIVLFISNSRYVRFSYILPFLATAWAFYYLGLLLSSFGFLANKPRIYLLPVIFSAIIAATATFRFSSQYGIDGMVLGLGLAGLLYALWCLFITKKLLKGKKCIRTSN